MTQVETQRASGVVPVIRWMAVLPAALMGAFLVSFPVHWVAVALGSDDLFNLSDEAVGNVEVVASGFFIPLAFVLAGARVAPKHHVGVAVALASILLLCVAANFAYVALSPSPTVQWRPRCSIAVACAILGIVVALLAARSASARDRLTTT